MMIHEISTVIDNKCSKFQQTYLDSRRQRSGKEGLNFWLEYILLSPINMSRVNDDRGLDQAEGPTDIDSQKDAI